jgi:hypothetical protein
VVAGEDPIAEAGCDGVSHCIVKIGRERAGRLRVELAEDAAEESAEAEGLAIHAPDVIARQGCARGTL